ncbi:MAG: hypothetical protein ACUVXJ_01610, partial [Phycisphaerae bacterium]
MFSTRSVLIQLIGVPLLVLSAMGETGEVASATTAPESTGILPDAKSYRVYVGTYTSPTTGSKGSY